jgi:SAM-dependent methyltransferase
MPLSQFLAAFRSAYESGQLLKCTLSKPTPAAAPDLKNVYLRPVALKKGLHIAFNFRYKTRDEVKNYELDEALRQLSDMLGKTFLNVDLLTPDRDFSLSFSNGNEPVFFSRKASHSGTPDTAHDRSKPRLLDSRAPWLHALGITTAGGQVKADAQDKWRQINKYLEIIEDLLRDHPLPNDARVADMGSGKGYLTFALYDLLKNRLGMAPVVTGIELRPKLVDFCNKAAKTAGFDGLQFVSTDISEYRPERLDMLIALHACDTATDLALAAGVHNRAGIIVAAPCCHKQIRKELHTRNELAPVLKHGILEERQAEILTDGIRALLLESEGYKTKVFEFVSTEHTAKNLMITATQDNKPASEKKRGEALAKVAALKAGFGIGTHYLEGLLGDGKQAKEQELD